VFPKRFGRHVFHGDSFALCQADNFRGETMPANIAGEQDFLDGAARTKCFQHWIATGDNLWHAPILVELK
jgi:hypothetical protein